MLDSKLVKPEDTHEARRAAADAARPPVTERAFPPAFDAPARGVAVGSSVRAHVPRARCVECGAVLLRPPHGSAGGLCAECAGNE